MIRRVLDDLVLDAGGEGLEELGRRLLSEGPWTTVAYLVRTCTGEGPWEGPFLWLHRHQKCPQGWKLVSRFRPTEEAQLERLLRALQEWGLLEAWP